MPLIAGGIYRTPQARESVQRLVKLTSGQIVHDKVELEDQAGFMLVSGRQKMESTAEKIHVLDEGNSLLAGRLFTKDVASSPVIDIDAKKVRNSGGRFLGEAYWGSYIMVSFDKERYEVSIYRDPQGLSTLFYLAIEEGMLFASEVHLLVDALEAKPAIDWEYLTSYVINAHNVSNYTPFKGVVEAEQGCETRLSVPNKVAVSLFWDPTKFVTPTEKSDAEFQEELYRCMTSCTQAWARESDKLCVELSGGLDSSSLLCVLKDILLPEQKLTAINMMHPDVASSNEVDYARNVSDLCEVPLTVANWGDALPFSSIDVPRRYNRPASFMLNYDFGQFVLKSIAIGQQGEVMGGQGGDHLFLAPPLIASVADHFIDKGITGISSKLREISAYYRTPYFQVVKDSCKNVWQYYQGNLGYLNLTMKSIPWMGESFKQSVNASMFKPFYWDKLKALPPGKVQHVLAVSQATYYIDRGYRITGKPVLNPLLSQPLVELALSMPTYRAFAEGYDRILFRRAVSDRKKGDFIWRKTKGETSGVLVIALKKRYAQMSELILEGKFAQKGLINKAKLEHSLREAQHGKVENLWPLLNLMVAETWLRSWR